MDKTLTFRECQPDGSRYNARIGDATWNLYRHRLEQMHNRRLPRATMLDILKHDCKFYPSLPQLNARLKLWDYTVYASKHGPTRPLTTQELDAGSSSEQSAEQASPHTELVGSPITVSTLSREDSRQGDFSPPLERSELSLPSFQVITEDGDVHLKDTTCSYEATEEIHVSCPGAETSRNVFLPVYCSQSCCENMIRNHRYLIAAQFLTSLQCKSSASSILFPMVADMASDPSVASSDHVWAYLNCERLSRSLSATDQRADWRHIDGPLHEYISSANSTGLPGPLAHITLTSQYRKTRVFTHNRFLASATLSSGTEVRIVHEEIMGWETRTKLLLRLMLWSLRTLFIPAFRNELRQMAAHLGQPREHAKLTSLTLQRVLACHFLTMWIETPCSDISNALIELNGSFGVGFSLEVMLPEVFVSFAHMSLAQENHSPVTPGLFEHDASIDRFVEKTSTSFGELCRLPMENYVAEFAQALLLTFSQSTLKATERTCPYSEQLVERLACRIMGESHIDRHGSKKAVSNPHLGWMPLAYCFKVQGVTFHNTPASTGQDTVSPRDANPLAEDLLSSQRAKFTGCVSLEFPASASPPMGEPATTNVDGVVALSRRSSHHSRTSKDRDETDPPSKPTLAIRVARTDTKSSGNMSIDSMRELNSRIQARQTAREIGPVRNSSSSSRMRLSSQFRFTKVTGFGRGDSTASKFSFSPEGIDAVTACMDERLSHADTGEMTEEAAELHRKVTEWITREFSPKKRPDFTRRSTEPAFMMEASRLRSEVMLVEV